MALPSECGYKSNPSYDGDGSYELLSTVGYVTRIWVEQEDTSSTIRFRLRIYTEGQTEPIDRDFLLLLDDNTSVCMAQLQLLRDAIVSYQRPVSYPYMVHVHFNFRQEAETDAFVYWLRLIYDKTLPPGSTVQDYSSVEIPEGDWYWH